jgi:hypothetical protein
VPKKQSTAAQRAREAACQGGKYTRVLRDAPGATADVTEPDARFGGHELGCR